MNEGLVFEEHISCLERLGGHAYSALRRRSTHTYVARNTRRSRFVGCAEVADGTTETKPIRLHRRVQSVYRIPTQQSSSIFNNASTSVGESIAGKAQPNTTSFADCGYRNHRSHRTTPGPTFKARQLQSKKSECPCREEGRRWEDLVRSCPSANVSVGFDSLFVSG